jgi:hypothetical protein
MASSTARYAIMLGGACPESLRALVGARFDLVTGVSVPGQVLVVDHLDQAALRALLLLLWDAGLEVVGLAAKGAALPVGDSHKIKIDG